MNIIIGIFDISGILIGGLAAVEGSTCMTPTAPAWLTVSCLS